MTKCAFVVVVVVAGVSYFLSTIECRLVPYTPCMKLFNYYESHTHEIFGAMKFRNDLSGEYHLVVTMSIAMDTYKNIRVERRTSEHKIKNGEDIEYYIHFPFNHTFPLLTSVVFNGKTYCTGPGEQRTADHGVTVLSDRDDLSTKINEGVIELHKMHSSVAKRPTQIIIINV